MITNAEKIDLKRLMKKTVEEEGPDSIIDDNTDQIRSLKHSVLIMADVRTFANLKQDQVDLQTSDPVRFDAMATEACAFLHEHYVDLFQRMLRNEMDYNILLRMLAVLRRIEDGAVDQHEGSVEVGKILKELYVDSALRRGQNLDEKYAADKPVVYDGKSGVSWRDFKQKR
jgi:hypothetical protein